MKFPVEKILIDNGSSVNFIYWNCFEKMNLSYDRLKKVSSPLFSFLGESVPIMGSIQLEITLVSDLRRNRARRGDQKKAHSCYVSSIKGKQLLRDETLAISEDSVDKRKAMKKVEPVRLKYDDPDKVTYLESGMTGEIKREVVSYLKKNVDVFAWTPADMPDISLEMISHHLNVDPSIKPIKQKRRNMAPEKQHALEEEIDKLIRADFIEEVQYPEWLANVIMVKK
ncbi:uncharacterized protein LOC120276122 [Dioscorea cayenensis subsp. rotundata]|uniref:Uncharacterized protein LOC120276122 n=1 Tax=Dioscorea cayennensis subsp. rotundata TaxID=55577 RepID=A0AB40CJK6_DIOCR|nr:uncharacterized protein LOC120276122 [Dioscorea cayenensis subsp. rotundata]